MGIHTSKTVISILIAASLAGCGGSTSDFTASPTSVAASSTNSPTSGVVAQETATVRLLTVVNQTVVPSSVTQVRGAGFDAEGSLVYGPTTHPLAAVIDFTEVPIDVVSMSFEFLDQSGKSVTYAQASVSLTENSVFELGELVLLESPLSELSVSPDSLSLSLGTDQQLTAVGRFADDNSSDLTSSVVWSVQDSSIATVENGLVVSQAEGRTTITASLGAISISIPLEVTAPSKVFSLPSGTSVFNTDSGTLDGVPVDEYDLLRRRFVTDFFAIEEGAILQIEGSSPLYVEATRDISIDGAIELIAAEGAVGNAAFMQAGRDLEVGLNGSVLLTGGGGSTGNPGTLGAAGGPLGLIAARNVLVEGVVESVGGQGGAGRNGTSPGPNSIGQNGKTGGDGAPAGEIAISAASVEISGTVTSRGGSGGNGGNANSAASGGTGGEGGSGAAAEAVNIDSNEVTISGLVQSVGGSGGAGGNGAASTSARRGGVGGNGGSSDVVTIAAGSLLSVSGSVQAVGGTGGQGGRGGGFGGNGAEGGLGGSSAGIVLSGPATSLLANILATGGIGGKGGNGSGSGPSGGDGGDGGDGGAGGSAQAPSNPSNPDVSGGAGGLGGLEGSGYAVNGSPGAAGNPGAAGSFTLSP